MIHITNGDNASNRLREADIPGTMVSWNDVLHDGPVPAGLTLDEMSQIRAGFIHHCGWATPSEAQLHFQTRDAMLLSEMNHESEVVVWNSFELYDQLHMLQVLAWFRSEYQGTARPTIIFCPGYLGNQDLTDEKLTELFEQRHRVTDEMLEEATQVWEAFTAPSPRALEAYIRSPESSQFPYLKDGMKRMLMEYPDRSGLSLTEQFILQSVSEFGSVQPGELFTTVRGREKVAFMGDASFWRILQSMIESKAPLLLSDNDSAFSLPGLMIPDPSFLERKLSLTENGEQVLEGKVDWLASHWIDRWVGGVHFSSVSCWRFDREERIALRK